MRDADASLIAAAVNALPELLAAARERDELKAERDRLLSWDTDSEQDALNERHGALVDADFEAARDPEQNAELHVVRLVMEFQEAWQRAEQSGPVWERARKCITENKMLRAEVERMRAVDEAAHRCDVCSFVTPDALTVCQDCFDKPADKLDSMEAERDELAAQLLATQQDRHRILMERDKLEAVVLRLRLSLNDATTECREAEAERDALRAQLAEARALLDECGLTITLRSHHTDRELLARIRAWLDALDGKEDT
jgi:regulator of replication initiation timing